MAWLHLLTAVGLRDTRGGEVSRGWWLTSADTQIAAR